MLQLISIISKKDVCLAQMDAFHVQLVIPALNADHNTTITLRRVSALKFVETVKDFLCLVMTEITKMEMVARKTATLSLDSIVLEVHLIHLMFAQVSFHQL